MNGSAPLDYSRGSSRHRSPDGTGTRSILKSSMKYSKPPCLQNTSMLLNNSMLKNTNLSHNRSVHVSGDHDDLKLKLDKLCEKFLEANKEKNAFKDTFFDEDIYQEILASKNYFKLSLDLMKYVLHSGNQKKKLVPKKNTTSLGMFSQSKLF